MARAKAIVRRLRQPTFVPAPGQRIGNNIMNRRNTKRKLKLKLKLFCHKLKKSRYKKMFKS